LKKLLEKKTNSFYSNQSGGSQSNYQQKNRKEGEVTITNSDSQSKKTNSNKEGEYVDFEEVD